MGADTVVIGQWNGTEVMARLSPESGKTAGKVLYFRWILVMLYYLILTQV